MSYQNGLFFKHQNENAIWTDISENDTGIKKFSLNTSLSNENLLIQT